jgi:hypothetical protein
MEILPRDESAFLTKTFKLSGTSNTIWKNSADLSTKWLEIKYHIYLTKCSYSK